MHVSRWVPYGALVVTAGLVIAGANIASNQDRYQPAQDGISLGPARSHAPAVLDPLARVAVGAASAAAGSATPAPSDTGPSTETAQEQNLLDLTNQARSDTGLQPLTFDPDLLPIARERAASQTNAASLSHYDDMGSLAFISLLDDANVPYSMAGENLARSEDPTADVVPDLQQALMNSPAHRANILQANYTSLAIGAATGTDGDLAFSEIFLDPSSS